MSNSAKLYINRAAIAANYASLCKELGRVECGAVVKANAYGLGVEEAAKALHKKNCRSFFVAHLDEAIELRKIFDEADFDAEIFVFHGVQKNEASEFLEYGLTPVINNPAQLANWQPDLPCAVHVDTGMTRLGFALHEAELLAEQNMCLLMTHLAVAELPQSPKNFEQLHAFDNFAKHYPRVKRSVANSYGIALGREFHANLARPGIALYGGNLQPNRKDFANSMENVVWLTAPILQVNHLQNNASIGYGATYQAQKGDIVATVAIGYADGIFRNLGNSGKCFVAGHEAAIVGRVSMDLICISLNKVPENLRQVGQEVEILGDNYTIAEMAKAAGTIEYEVLTSLGQRFERIYR